MARSKRRRVKIVLQDERPWSLNTVWAGVHWGRRKKYADRTHELIAERAGELGIAPFVGRVSILVRVYVQAARDGMDPDNVLAKPYIDGLRHAGVLRDDRAAEVRRVSYEVRTGEPRVEIHVTEDADRRP